LDKYKHKVFTHGARFVDTESFKKRRELGERENVIGYVGRLELAKGVIDFVEAIPSVLENNPNVRFLISGSGTLFGLIKDKLEYKRLTSHVVLSDWIPHQRLPDFLNEMKLIVLPSYSEGLPLVMLEAMACGTPVLATPVGNVSDVVKDGITGFIMENNSPECIAGNILRVLNCPTLEEITQNGRNLVHSEFTYQAAVQRYSEIFGDLLKNE
jgi:glycosyltransferase involved in cell wall biosynthesis